MFSSHRRLLSRGDGDANRYSLFLHVCCRCEKDAQGGQFLTAVIDALRDQELSNWVAVTPRTADMANLQQEL